MKNLLKALSVLILSTPLQAEEVKIFIWEYFISDNVINKFTEQTGHTVKQYYFDDEGSRNAIIMNGQAAIYDLVLVDNATTLGYGKEGVFNSLKSSGITNIDNNNVQAIGACGEYGIPYSTGTMGIAHRASITKQTIDSWSQILTPPEEHVGTTMMLRDDIDTVAIALLAQGLNPFTADKEELKLAYTALQKQSPSLMQYGYPLSYVNQEATQSALTLAVIYSGDVYNLKELTGHDDWEYVVPKEGTLLFVDCFTSPSGNELKQATKEFLSYINEPTVAYENASEMWFSTTNIGAQALADDEYKNDSEISPSKEVLSRSYRYKIMPSEDLVIRNRMVSILNTKK